MQTLFLEWLAARDVGLALRLLEQTPDKAAYNLLFDRQLSDLLRRVDKPAEQRQLESMLTFDWYGEIERGLQRAGFGREADEMAHDIVVKLLVSPGGLFAGWKGQPMEARFRASTKNAIVSLIQKRATRRRLLPTVSMDPAMAFMGEPEDTLVQDFIEFLRDRHGELAASVFQHRFSGGRTHELFGKAGSRHVIKQAVRDIKTAAKEFAVGDREFQKMVEKAFAREKATVRKRRAAVAKR